MTTRAILPCRKCNLKFSIADQDNIITYGRLKDGCNCDFSLDDSYEHVLELLALEKRNV